VQRIDLQAAAVGGGTVGAGVLAQFHPALADVVVGEQVVRALVTGVEGRGVGDDEGEVPAGGVALGLRPGIAGAQGQLALGRQAPAAIDAEAVDAFVDLAERGLVVEVAPEAVLVLEEPDLALVRAIAAGAGVRGPPLDADVVVLAEAVLAGQLGVDQFALDPAGGVVAAHLPGLVAVAFAAARFLLGVMHVHGADADPVPVPLQVGGDEAVHRGLVGRGQVLLLAQDLGGAGACLSVLAEAVLGLPAVGQAGGGHDAETGTAQVHRGARVDAVAVVGV